jgi:nitrate reductase gamma subunit
MSVNRKPTGRLSLYLLLAVVLTVFTMVILLLPYDTVYVQDRAYLRWFLVVMVASVVAFTFGVVSNVLMWMRGRGLVGTPESRLMRASAKALSFALSRRMARLLRVFLKEALYIARLRDLSLFRWFAHFMILGGFVLMFLLDIIVTISLDLLRWEAMISSDGWAKLLVRDMAFEVAGSMMLIGLAMAIGRRFIARPKQLKTEGADVVTLAFLFLVVAGGFVLEGMGIAGRIPGHETHESYSFVGYAFSLVMPGSAGDYYDQAWLVHGVMSALLIAYIPFSKLFHMITAPVAIELEALLGREAGSR